MLDLGMSPDGLPRIDPTPGGLVLRGVAGDVAVLGSGNATVYVDGSHATHQPQAEGGPVHVHPDSNSLKHRQVQVALAQLHADGRHQETPTVHR
eukprot:gene5154-biopygen4590